MGGTWFDKAIEVGLAAIAVLCISILFTGCAHTASRPPVSLPNDLLDGDSKCSHPFFGAFEFDGEAVKSGFIRLERGMLYIKMDDGSTVMLTGAACRSKTKSVVETTK